MADVKKIVTIARDGSITILKDLEDGTTYSSVRDSFEIKPGARKTIYSQRTRRYAGALAANESHENAAISWKVLVAGSTADAVNANAESMLEILERATLNTFLQWQPDGASAATYYEIMGPATWSLTYKWVQYTGTKTMVVDVQLPVAPLARGALVTQTFGSTAMPESIALPSTVTGSAPALCDVSVRCSGGSNPPIWALIGWTRRPKTPMSGSIAPFGTVDAENYDGLTTWAAIGAGGDTNYRNSNGIRTTTSGAGTASAYWTVDPSVMQADDFTRATIDIEVWGRVELAAGVVSPKLTLSLEPNAGTSFGGIRYTAEYGSAGKLLTKPSSGTVFRFVRLGTITMPIDAAEPLKWNLKLSAAWSTSSTGVFGVDYLVMVPARSRAVSKSGVANDSAYPDFIASTSDTRKIIRSDLSGLVSSGAANPGLDAGLGGTPIELPPGDVNFCVKLSSLVPDDPTSDTTSEQKEHTGVTGSFAITPRYWAVK